MTDFNTNQDTPRSIIERTNQAMSGGAIGSSGVAAPGPVVTGGGGGGGDNPSDHINQTGVLGVDLLGGVTNVAGVAGGVASGAAGGLFAGLNAPWHVVESQVARIRLEHAIRAGDQQVSQRYIKMVTDQHKSLSEVADQMATDGVGITGGTPHDLLLSMFLDPMNLVAMGIGKAWDVGKRASNIEAKYTDSVHSKVSGEVVKTPGVTAEDIAWLNKPGRKVLAHAYNTISKPLQGAKRGLAQAIFGTAAGKILAYIGVTHLKTIMSAAEDLGKGQQATEALAGGINHVTKMAGADVMVSRALESNLADAERKARIIASATGKDDQNAFNLFYDATSSTAQTGDFTVKEAKAVFDDLIDIRNAAIKKGIGSQAQQIVGQHILASAVAGTLRENIGGRGLVSNLADIAANDTVRVGRTAAAQREVAVADNMIIVAQGEDAVKSAFIENLTPAMGADAAALAWERTLANAPKSGSLKAFGDVGRRTRYLAESLYATESFRLGAVSETFGTAKQRLVDTLANPQTAAQLLRALPNETRAMIVEQYSRASIVAKDTMTDVSYRELMKSLNSQELSIAEKATIAQKAVLENSNLRRAFDAQTFSRALAANPEDQIKMLLEHLQRPGFVDNLPKEIPVAYKGLDGIEPIRTMQEAAQSGGYKIIIEPPTLTTNAMINYAENAGKVTARAGTDVWVPITSGRADIQLGNRNIFGRFIDVLSSGTTNSMLVANSMTRLQEFAIRKEIPLSRNELIALHDELMQEAFRSGGSIRTAYLDSHTNPAVKVIDNVINKVAQRDLASAEKLRVMKNNGELRQMIFYATEGDLSKVGIPTKITGWLKTHADVGDVVTQFADFWYPKVKFKWSHIFSGQEVFESKWWNIFRGYQSEWKISSKLPEPLRIGEKRYYDVIDPMTGEKLRLDSMQIINDQMLADRAELRAAQDLAAINQFYGQGISDAVIRFGAANEGFIQSMKAFLKRTPGVVKGMDYMAFVRTEGLDNITPVIASALKEHAPAQWELYMSAAGQSEKGAALLFLRERQVLTSNRNTVRMYIEHNKPMGIGFGRQYSDDPIKNLNTHLKEMRATASDSYTVQKESLVHSEKVLSTVRAEALSIGYSDESLKTIDDAIKANADAQKALKVTSENIITKKSVGARAKAIAAAQDASSALRKEFQLAVSRKKLISEALIASGVESKIAKEMSDLFVVAERRMEMIPELSLAVTKAMNGEELTVKAVQGIADHLMKIRQVRGEEESLWNAVAHGLDGAMYNADKTHFFKTDRNLLERSINHPFLAFYPASYMFNKVLPEYARFLYLTPKNSAARMFLKPYQYIVHAATGGKFTPAMWGEFAPLVGWNAMMKARMALADQFGTDQPKKMNPIANLFTNVIVPGFPWDISVSLSSPVITGIKGIAQGNDPLTVTKDVLLSAGAQVTRTDAFARQLNLGSSLVGQAQSTPLEEIQTASMDMLQSIHDFILNK